MNRPAPPSSHPSVCLLLGAIAALAVVPQPASQAGARQETSLQLTFCCQPDNDLYRILSAYGFPNQRFETIEAAVGAAPTATGVLLLGDGYPETATALGPALLQQARARGLRLYIEYPGWLPGLEVGPPQPTQWERAVVASDVFAPELEKLRILALHDCHFVPLTGKASAMAQRDPLLVTARVAGFDTAVYGLPQETFPLLFEHPDGNLLVATTKLSHFLTGRYAPQPAWRVIWRRILTWLAPGADLPPLNWTPSVRPSYGPYDDLPAGVEADALRRGAEWFRSSCLLVHPAREEEIARLVEESETAPLPPRSTPVGDGSLGILEGYSTRIRSDGSQEQRLIRRGDCHGESAMGIAFGGTVGDRSELCGIAANLLDFYLLTSIAQQGPRADPEHPAFGLVAWGITNWAWEKAFYGDDNARLLLGTMATAALLGEDRWDEAMLRCLLGNLRTTGTLGFRRNRIDLPDLEAIGWRACFDDPTVSYSAHYQAYLWACYLWAYRATGFDLFRARAVAAIRAMMAVYPDRWHWTISTSLDRSRILLPLAWLVQVEDTPEHRAWLRAVAEDLLALQAPCGAIREEFAPADQTTYGPPRSNAEYAVTEAALFQQNGDPVCDLLYTCNFAFIGLHEAAAATGDPVYAEAEARLAEFLCRIQVRSESHPELDGAWYRAFDFQQWEYWASNADIGWGAWSIETGWTQGWITAVLGLRQMRTSLWELTAGSHMGRHLEDLLPRFLPDAGDG